MSNTSKPNDGADMDIPVIRNVLEANDKMADQLRKLFARHGVLVLNLIS